MKNWKKILLVALPMTLALAFTSFAGEWKDDMNGWWYQNDDGSYLTNGWYWLDGNHDGVAECYYFDKDGYMVREHGYVDGYEVDENGAWIVNGRVQTQAAEVEEPSAPATENNAEAVAIYQAAAQKNNQLDGMEMLAKYNITMGVEDSSLTMGMDMNLKMKNLRSGNMQFYGTADMNLFGADMPMTIFYTDGYYYIDGMGEKMKMKLSFEEAMKSATDGAGMSEIDISAVRNLKMRKEGKNTILSFDADPAMYDDMMKEAMSSSVTSSAAPQITYKVNSGSCEVTINQDGYYIHEKMYMDMDMIMDGNTLNYKMDIDATINNPGQPVSFELPSTEGYTDVDMA